VPPTASRSPRAGRLELTGFLVEATAAGRAFEQLGIRPEFVRRGEHKTAPEVFIRAEVSPNQRAALEQFLDERHADLVDAVARGRRAVAEDARARVDQGPYSATRARRWAWWTSSPTTSSYPRRSALIATRTRALAGSRGSGSFRDWERRTDGRAPSWMAGGADAPGGGAGLGDDRPGSVGRTTGRAHHRRLGDARRRAPRRGARSGRPPPRCSTSTARRERARLRARLAEVRRLAARKPVVAYVDRVAASGDT
jgi:protease-4